MDASSTKARRKKRNIKTKDQGPRGRPEKETASSV